MSHHMGPFKAKVCVYKLSALTPIGHTKISCGTHRAGYQGETKFESQTAGKKIRSLWADLKLTSPCVTVCLSFWRHNCDKRLWIQPKVWRGVPLALRRCETHNCWEDFHSREERGRLEHFANQHSQAFSKPFIIHHSPLLFRSPNSRVLPREMNGSMFWFQHTDPINLERRLEAINSVH